MSNTITLPNGAEWDNDLAFRENTPEAQYWFFETLKLALIEAPIRTANAKKTEEEKEPVSVLCADINTRGSKRDLANMCYSELHRDGLKLTCGIKDFYTHKDWPDMIQNPIPDEEFFNVDNWTYSNNIKFQINEL